MLLKAMTFSMSQLTIAMMFQVNLSKEDIVNSRLIYAPKEVNMNFENLVRPIFKVISLNNAEILKLNDVAIQIQAQLSR